MNNSSDEFGQWLTQVARLDDNDDVEFNAENYKEVLLELGYTESDFKKVESAVEQHLSVARQHQRFERWKDASEQLEIAASLAPWLGDLWLDLSGAYLELYAQKKESSSAQKSEHWARKRIDHFPDDERSYEILNTLDELRKNARTRQKKSRHRILYIGLIVLVHVGVLTYVFLGSPSPTLHSQSLDEVVKNPRTTAHNRGRKATKSQVVRREEASELGPITVIQPTVAPVRDPGVPGVYGLPLSVDGNQRIGHIEIDATLNRLDISEYKSLHTAKIMLRIKNQKGPDLMELKGTVEWRDEKGQLLGSKQLTLLSTANAKVRQGQSIVHGSIQSSVPSGTVAAHFVVTVSQRAPQVHARSKLKPMCVEWKDSRPDHILVDVHLRSIEKSLILWRYELEIVNRSTTPIQNLMGTLMMYDEKKNPLGLRANGGPLYQKYIATSWKPPFLPGETRAISVIARMNPQTRKTLSTACLSLYDAR